ncbi:Inner membrane protein YbaL [bacterium HR23]|nr:Inner membrane protein YbaL [bacterium HR23]
MAGLPTMVEIVVAVAAAFLFGGVARRLGQPPVLGYILAGVVVGPYATGLIGDTAQVTLLAQLGVAFLMFQAGTELSLSHLRRMSHFTLLGPFLQLALTAPLIVVAVVAGLPWAQAFYLGLILSLSSTTMVAKLLAQRGETDTLHGRLALPFTIVQDLPLPLALVVVSALGRGEGAGSGVGVVVALGKAVAFVVVAYALGAQVMPSVLRRVAHWGRELLLLAAVALALGMAYLTFLLGVSMALGAFVAGLLLADTDVSRKVLKEVSPVSDIFVTFFFLSVGMLLDIPFVLKNPAGVGLVLVLVVVVKTLILIGVGLAFGFRGRTVVLTALLMAQIGEEAFLLAQTGLAVGFLSSNAYSLVLAGAVLSILVNPAVVSAGDGLTRLLRRLPWAGGVFREPRRTYLGRARHKEMMGHTIICGYGQVGQETAQALESRGYPYVVVDLDGERLRPLRAQGIPCILGDAGDPEVLEQAGVARASAVAVTFSDRRSVERVVRAVRGVRRGVEVVARASGEEGVVESLRELGASEVIHPSFEASLGFVRMVLRAAGVPPREVERFVTVRRVTFYG